MRKKKSSSQMRSRTTLAALAAIALAVAACSGGETTEAVDQGSEADADEAEPDPDSAEDSEPEEGQATAGVGMTDEGLPADGTLTLVTTGRFAPFTQIDPDTGEVEGYSIDIGAEIADRLGLELVTPTVDFAAELQGLAAGRYDLADSGIWPSPERQEQFLFTDPMISSGWQAAVAADRVDEIDGFPDLSDLVVGSTGGSSEEAYVVENEAELGYSDYQGFASVPDGLLAVQQGRIDVFVVTQLVTLSYMDNNPGLVEVAGEVVNEIPLSMAINIENEAFQALVNEALAEMKEDGTLAELQVRWFGNCVPVPDDINDEPPYEQLLAGC